MKSKLLFFIPILLLLFSCKKENNVSRTETITNGSKWGLQIGSSASAVYAQLQQLGIEKGFSDVAVVGQQTFSKPEELQRRLPFYRSITLTSPASIIQRVIIVFDKDQVSSIEAGGALPDVIDKWPQDVPSETAIHKNDQWGVLYNKLLAIYQIPAYSNYLLNLPDKTLSKDFDPEMANYDEWGVGFVVDVKPGKSGRNSVSLYFKNGKLGKIRCTYDEVDVYN